MVNGGALERTTSCKFRINETEQLSVNGNDSGFGSSIRPPIYYRKLSKLALRTRAPFSWCTARTHKTPMASAPPMEAVGAMQPPPPPSYEEALTSGPPYPVAGPGVPPPAYSKGAQPPYQAQPSYPAQPYTPVTSPPPPGVTSPMVSVQTVYVQPGMVFRESPVQTVCPKCAQPVITSVEYNSGAMTWLTCAGLFIFGCIYGCCLIPFCVDSLKDVTHYCPNCRSVLGVFRRL